MMLEFAESSLAAWLSTQVPAGNLSLRWKFACQIVQGVLSIHERCILHLDLKPANVLIVTKQAGTCAKISDFGLSMKLKEGRSVIQGDLAYSTGYRPQEAVLAGRSQAGLGL